MKCILVIAASLALFACGKTGTSTTGTGVISLNGGNGGTVAGGNGGNIATSGVFGDLKFHVGGSVDASFSLPGINPDFGVNPATIASTTTVEFSPSAGPLPPAGTYFVTDNDSNLHLVNQSGTASVITGLTVNAGQTLRLSNLNLNGSTVFTGAVVINGTVTNRLDQDGGNLDLRSDSLLLINPGGKVITTPVAAGAPSGLLTLIATNGILINQGIVESNGTAGTGATVGGTSGGITLQAGTFLYNTNTITAKGGKSDSGAGGLGGNIQLQADGASFATSGIIDASGGDGGAGGAGGSLTFSGGSVDLGRVVVAGTVTSNGGTGLAGNGGNSGASITLTSNSGGILVNATFSAKGGEGKGAGSIGGNGCPALQLTNNAGTIPATSLDVSPEGIKVGGNITLDGGPGAAQGGDGGRIDFSCGNALTALPGFANVEFFGYQSVNLNGGAANGGNGGAGGHVDYQLTTPTVIINTMIPAGGITSEVAISAKGGDGNLVAGSSGTGGNGGTLIFTAPDPVGTTDPLRTLVTNSGGIDVSSGSGDIGGAVGSVTMSAYGNLTNSGGITARGGKGTTSGSAGGSVQLTSLASNVVNSGGIVVIGGDGSTGGFGGSVSISSGTQTTTAGISANGGNSLTGGTGGNGGTIVLDSNIPSGTIRTSLNVARGSGGASNGTIIIDGQAMATRLPLSGAI